MAKHSVHSFHHSTQLVDLQKDTYVELGSLVMSKLFLASVVHYPILLRRRQGNQGN